MGTITCLAMHPVGGVVASGAWTGTIKLWDLQTGKDLRTIEAHSLRIYGLAFSPSGRILASASKDTQIALWQMPEGTPIARTFAHDAWIRGVEFVKEDTLLSIGSDRACKIWRLSYRFPTSERPKTYRSAEDVLNDYRRPDEEDGD